MITSKLIITTASAILLTMPAHAQFNTIGTINGKRIKTTNPTKSNETLTDSIVLGSPILEPKESIDTHQVSNSTIGKNKTSTLISPPLRKIQITSGFGTRKHPIYHKQMMHNGVDLSARYENVYSMFPGIVIRVGQDDRSGKFVTVRTGNYTISYCHLSQQLVNIDDYVNAGTNIAVSGNTGASTGPHLHITARKDGKAFNPAILLEYLMSQK